MASGLRPGAAPPYHPRLNQYRTGAGNDAAPAQLIRYQHANHLGSAQLELDDQAAIISYEEYFPYGGTAYQAVRNQTDAPKRYRFSGKERDEVKRMADIFRGRIIDVTEKTYTIELTGDGAKLDAFIEALDRASILETVRTGTSGIARGERVLKV